LLNKSKDDGLSSAKSEQNKLKDLNSYLARMFKNELLEFLLASTEPVWESELLKIAFPEIEIAGDDSLELFQAHFSLFHELYNLQNELIKQDRYLHVHFMRTVVRCFPVTGECREFFDDSADFCRAPCVEESTKCRFHFPLEDLQAIDMLSEKYFYLDKQNFASLNAETAEKFINGAWQLLQDQDDYQKCLKIMGLPAGVTVDLVKKRFRHMAKTMHPDVSSGFDKEFAAVNSAYRKLLAYLGAV